MAPSGWKVVGLPDLAGAIPARATMNEKIRQPGNTRSIANGSHFTPCEVPLPGEPVNVPLFGGGRDHEVIYAKNGKVVDFFWEYGMTYHFETRHEPQRDRVLLCGKYCGWWDYSEEDDGHEERTEARFKNAMAQVPWTVRYASHGQDFDQWRAWRVWMDTGRVTWQGKAVESCP